MVRGDGTLLLEKGVPAGCGLSRAARGRLRQLSQRWYVWCSLGARRVRKRRTPTPPIRCGRYVAATYSYARTDNWHSCCAEEHGMTTVSMCAQWEDMQVKPWDASTWGATHFAAWSLGLQLLLGAHFHVGSVAGKRPSDGSPFLDPADTARVTAVAGKIAVACIGPGLISVGLGTWEPIPPRGKSHIIPGPLQGRDFWYMWYAHPHCSHS